MITPQYLGKRFQASLDILAAQTDGLTHEDSLIQPPYFGNCLNWVLGHLLVSRLTILERILGGQGPIDRAELSVYERGSDPILANTDGVLPMERLLELLNATQGPIEEKLNNLTPEGITAPFEGGSGTVGETLIFFYFHETYHVGQTEIHRQFTGVNDKII